MARPCRFLLSYFLKLTLVAFSLETYKESFSDPAGPKASSKFWGGSEIPSNVWERFIKDEKVPNKLFSWYSY